MNILKDLIPYQYETTQSLRLRKFLSLALIVGLLQTFSWTYQIIEAPSATGAITYNPGDVPYPGRITVPTGVDTVTVTLIGGGGGSGGTDGAGNTNPAPGARGTVTATYRVTAGDLLGIYPGNKGSDGTNGANNSGGGAGGTSTYSSSYNGGAGGNAGSSGGSGGGGGGGAATLFLINYVIQAVAGGAGGGGGQSNQSGSGQPGKDDALARLTTVGGDGIQTSLANSPANNTGSRCTRETNDGGGGGGGGGGLNADGGGGGSGGQIINGATGECAGDGGYRGSNWWSTSSLSVSFGTNSTSNTSNGSISLTYQLNKPTGVAATPVANSDSYINVSWNSVTATSTYDVKIYNSYYQLLATKRVTGTNSTAITPSDYGSISNSTYYLIGVTAIAESDQYASSTESTRVNVTTVAATGATSETDTAISLTGENNSILYATSNSNNQIPDTFTAQAWVYPTSYACKGGSASPWNTNDYYCHIMAKGNVFDLFVASDNPDTAQGGESGLFGFIWSGTAYYSRYKLALNEWHHVAFTRSGPGSAQTVLYVDGEVIYETSTSTSTANTTRDFTIGASRSEGTTTNDTFGKFIGQIDEVKISRKPRSKEQIQNNLYSYYASQTDFLLAYDFNENSGTKIFNRIDNAPANTHLTVSGGGSYDSRKIFEIDTTTVTSYTVVKFYRSYLSVVGGWRIPASVNSIRALLVSGGGGGGGGWNGGGGGGGGYFESTTSVVANSVYRFQIGVGGNGALSKYGPTKGIESALAQHSNNSILLYAFGGGAGATEQNVPGGPISPATSGGSGGGGSHGGGLNPGSALDSSYGSLGFSGGSGISDPQILGGGGGGGAGGVGADATTSSPGAGGIGVTSFITGQALNLAGGGAGSARFGSPLDRVFSGSGGGSNFGGGGGTVNSASANATSNPGTSGTTNTGGGGGAGSVMTGGAASGGNGGSGFIAIRYITNKPVITRQPVSDTVTAGTVETFTITTSAAQSPLSKSVKWQFTADTTTAIEANITGWTNVSTGTGFNTDTFTTAALTSAMNKYRYRAIVTFSDTSSVSSVETSTIAVLTVNSGITITADSSTITRKYGDAQTVRTITYSGGTTSSGAVGTSTSHTVTTPNRPLAGGKIWVDTTTSTAYFKVDTGTAVGTYTETVTVTDFYGISASYTQRIVVTPADTLTVQADTLTAITYNPAGMSINPTVTITGLVNSDTRSAVTINYSATGSTCANGGTCSEGDTGPGGGIVFKVIGSTYYEAAPKTWYSTVTYNGSSYSNSTVVYCANSSNSKIDPYNPPSNTSNTGWGGGKTNTDAFRAHCAKGAVGLVGTYSGGSKTDWYIPNATEMNGLQTYWNNRSALSTQFASTVSKYFWTSDASYNATWGWLLTQPYFDANGTWQTAGAAYNHQGGLILPIRSFTIDGAAQPALISTSTAPTNAGTFTLTPSALVLANNVDTSNYVSVVYRTSTFTINKARQDTLTVASVLGVYETGTATMQLTTLGGTDTGTVTYTIATGGTASGCSVTSNVLTVTSAGTCKLAATKAATLNYLIAYSDTATITFSRFVSRPIQVQLYPTMIPLNGGNSLETNSVTVSTLIISSRTKSGAGSYTIAGTGFSDIEVVRIGGTNLTGSNYTVGSVTSISLTGVSSLMGPLFIRRTDGQEAVYFETDWS